jgi:hypothetical protein
MMVTVRWRARATAPSIRLVLMMHLKRVLESMDIFAKLPLSVYWGITGSADSASITDGER